MEQAPKLNNNQEESFKDKALSVARKGMLALGLTSALGAEAAPYERPTDNNSSTSIEVAASPAAEISPDTLDLTPMFEQAPGSTSREITSVEFGEFFENDKAELGPESLSEAKQQLFEMLDDLNSDNINDIHSFILESSADTDPTKNWGGSNANLANGRADAVARYIPAWKAEWLAAKKQEGGLDASTLNKIETMPIIKKIPSYAGFEEGTTPLSRVINPETGTYFDESVMTSAEIEEAKEYARFVKFSAETYTTAEQLRDIIANSTNKYEKIHFLVDQSGSMMEHNRFDMVEALQAMGPDADGRLGFGSFSDKLHNQDLNLNAEIIKDRIYELKEGADNENAGAAVMQYLKGIEKLEGRQVLYVSTDEDIKLGNIGLANLLEEAVDKNTEVIFMIKNAETGAISYIQLDEIPELAKKSRVDVGKNGVITLKANPKMGGKDQIMFAVSSGEQLLTKE